MYKRANSFFQHWICRFALTWHLRCPSTLYFPSALVTFFSIASIPPSLQCSGGKVSASKPQRYLWEFTDTSAAGNTPAYTTTTMVRSETDGYGQRAISHDMGSMWFTLKHILHSLLQRGFFSTSPYIFLTTPSPSNTCLKLNLLWTAEDIHEWSELHLVLK